jgi:hypothetical protein
VRNAYKILVRKTEGKRRTVKIRFRYEKNTKINIKGDEIVCWIFLAQENGPSRSLLRTEIEIRKIIRAGNF